MQEYPKISIVTPSFNQGRFIERTICSVLDQNYPNLEYFIIDGGSTDETVDVIKKYENRISYWISEKDKGQSEAINKGFQKCTGDIIAWINSDDWYEPGSFSLIKQAFKTTNRKLIIGNCRAIYAGGNNEIIKPSKVSHTTMLRFWEPGFCPPQPSVFFSGDFLREGYKVREDLVYAMDLDLWLKMSEKSEFFYLDHTISNYLFHDESKSGEGSGFAKFMTEWKSVCYNHLENEDLLSQARFHFDYFLYRLKRKLK